MAPLFKSSALYRPSTVYPGFAGASEILEGGVRVGATIGVTGVATNASTTDATSYAFGWSTPTANTLRLVAIVSQVTGGQTENPTCTGQGLTWVSVANVLCGASSQARLAVFRGLGPSPTTGNVTVDYAAETQEAYMYSIIDVTGTDTSGTNGSGAIVQAITNTALSAASVTGTLAAFEASTNVHLSFSAGPVAVTWSAAGFAELADQSTITPSTSGSTQWLVNETSCVATPSSSVDCGIISIEIKSDAA